MGNILSTPHLTHFYHIIEKHHENRWAYSFTYLGAHFTPTLNAWEEISARLEKAQKVYGLFHKIWSSRRVSRTLKSRALQAYVLPVALWGCEAWQLSAADKGKLDAWYNKKARRILGVTLFDHIPTEEILKRTKLRKISDIVVERRLRYLGHIERYPENRWVKKTLTLVPEKKQGPGRPKETWRREMEAEMKARGLKLEDAHDREKWKEETKKILPKTKKKENHGDRILIP